jgi:hypothetical protein
LLGGGAQRWVGSQEEERERKREREREKDEIRVLVRLREWRKRTVPLKKLAIGKKKKRSLWIQAGSWPRTHSAGQEDCSPDDDDNHESISRCLLGNVHDGASSQGGPKHERGRGILMRR